MPESKYVYDSVRGFMYLLDIYKAPGTHLTNMD